jgi:hypothetical protein
MANDNYLRSIREIADFIGCSIGTAQKIKNTYPDIVYQHHRKFLIDKSDLLNSLRNAKK